jgi:hypothetical protein
MKHTFLIIILFTVFILPCTIVNAQQKAQPIITGEFKNLAASRFVNELEAQTGYRFYYDSTGFDSIKVSMNIQGRPLPEVLDSAFGLSGYRYTIYRTDVFITKGPSISTALPADFFARNNKAVGPAPAPHDMLTEDEEDSKPQSASLENKLYEIGIKTQSKYRVLLNWRGTSVILQQESRWQEQRFLLKN